MNTTFGAAVPATPQKRIANIAVEKVVRRLNSDYGLDIVLPDPTLSPAQRKYLGAQDEKFARHDRIYRGIQFLYYQRGDTLGQALDAFFTEAKADSLEWMPKPRADPSTLPSTRAPPKAQTPGQRWKLQSLLIEVIDRYKAQRIPALRAPNPQGENGVAGLGLQPASGDNSDAGSPNSVPESPASCGSKRSFDAHRDDNVKRLRASPCPGSPTHSDFTDALDNVPTRRRLHFPPPRPQAKPLQQQDEHRGSPRSNGSSTSPSSTRSSVFSSRNGAQSTQTTLDGDLKRSLAAFELPPPYRSMQKIPHRAPPVPNQSTIQAPVPRGLGAASQHSSPRSSGFRSSNYSDFSDSDVVLLEDALDQAASSPRNGRGSFSTNSEPTALQGRLQNIWPKFPRWLHDAPLAVAWEITRICLHCKVELTDNAVKYDPAWATSDMTGIWRSLSQLDVFRGKSFPERPSAEAFAAALSNFESRGNTVVMSAALEFNPSKTGPLFLLDMKPLKFDEGCRLTRRFGPDRFLEILIPSPTGLNAPPIVKDGGSEQLIQWLTQQPHSLVGRQWQAFYSKDAGYRKPAKDFKLGPDAKASFKERVHFFAENGTNFRAATIRSRRDIPTDTVQRRTRLTVGQMLDWLLQLERNESQPHLKLFSRIQLGLSKTFPALTFQPGQIRHHPEDILSPIGKVMNDGIGRMSRSVARKIRDALGLSDIPSAIQGRMGSAKGMWLMDVEDTGDVDWIETYPSQRKWDCDDVDPLHRTLEVRSVSSELKPAGLNLQFLPVLEDRARDRELMRHAIGNRLTKDLELQFENQKTALKRPLQFRQWVHENSNNRSERVKHGQVPFLGGLPESKAEILKFLLNSGFDPNRQKYLQELAWDLQKQKCDILRTKLNIRVGRSAYIYMVIDFWGVLEENEVHVGFSSKFQDESDDMSYTILSGMDVLVARSPAHFPSDIQKVKAVFRPELHALKDVIVFSAKGNIPLADKLSGGDYDGDMAWVCWDPDLVENFVNADMPVQPDLSAYLGKDKTTFKDLVRQTGRSGQAARQEAVYDMIDKSFQFAMQPNYLGICTNYKERICYHNNSVSNRAAILLSTLVGNLVDQSKQGIIFNAESWDRLRRDYFHGQMFLEDPAYKGDHWGGSGAPGHIIDHLKFAIAKPAIDRELESFHKTMAVNKYSTAAGSQEAAHFWDPDLAVYHDQYKELAKKSKSIDALMTSLKNAIGAVEADWKRLMSSRDSGVAYPDKVKQLYAKWQAIEPRAVSSTGSNRLDPETAALLEQPFLTARGAGATSYWALLKASVAFRTYYGNNAKFVWQMAGYQLAFIKAQVSPGVGGGEGMPLLVVPLMYAGSMPDGRFVKQYVARLEGDGSEYPDLEDGGVEGSARGEDVD